MNRWCSCTLNLVSHCFSVEGKQLVLGINHKRILYYINFNGFLEALFLVVTNLTHGGVTSDNFQNISFETILLWKSLLYFLGSIIIFGYCIIVSRSTLIRQGRIFNNETYYAVQGEIDIRGYYNCLRRECLVGIFMCSGYLARPFCMQVLRYQSSLWVAVVISTIVQLISSLFLEFNP